MKVKILTQKFSLSNKKPLACPSRSAMVPLTGTFLFAIAIAIFIVFSNSADSYSLFFAYAQNNVNSSLAS